MKSIIGSRAKGDIRCRADFFQYVNSNSNLVSFENTKPDLGHYNYILHDKKRQADLGKGIFKQSAASFKDEFVTRAKGPFKCFTVSNLLKLDQSRQILFSQITHYHSIVAFRVDKDDGRALIGLILSYQTFPYAQCDYLEIDANFTQESFTLRKYFVSSAEQYALIGNIKYAYKPGMSQHHWETTVIRIDVKNGKI